MRSNVWPLEFNNFAIHLLNHMRQKGYQYFRTPTLVESPGTEPYLKPFETQFVWGAQKQKFYLPFSPEYSLKKALLCGVENPFDLRPCFRNGELSSRHRAEFLMLEFYQQNITFASFMETVIHLIQDASQILGGGSYSSVQIRLKDWFAHRGFELTPKTQGHELQRWAEAQGWPLPRGWSFSDTFNWIYVEKIEPSLPSEQIAILHGYPPELAALAEIGEDGFAQRFEVYLGGLELGNAYKELRDKKTYLERFHKEQKELKELTQEERPLDPQLLEWLGNKDLPDCCGIALGVDRIFMAVKGVRDIRELYLF